MEDGVWTNPAAAQSLGAIAWASRLAAFQFCVSGLFVKIQFMSTLRHLTCLVVLAFVSAAGSAAAEKYKVGDALDHFTLKDQHEKEFTYTGGARLVIVAFTMGPGRATNSFLERQPPEFLERQHALFISNIHGMPGIGRAFALPKMKKYPHRILLADAEGLLDRYPTTEDRVTVLELDAKGVIIAIRFIDPAKEMTRVFPEAK